MPARRPAAVSACASGRGLAFAEASADAAAARLPKNSSSNLFPISVFLLELYLCHSCGRGHGPRRLCMRCPFGSNVPENYGWRRRVAASPAIFNPGSTYCTHYAAIGPH